MAHDSARVVFIMEAGTSLGRAVALEFARCSVTVGLGHSGVPSVPLLEIQEAVRSTGGNAFVVDGLDTTGEGGKGCFQQILDTARRLDFLVNLSVPTPEVTASQLRNYPGILLDRCATASEIIARHGENGAIVNQCMMASAYMDTPIESEVIALKMALVGATRALCIRYGGIGIRTHCLQTAMVDLPEIKAFVSDRALAAPVPLGRWATAEEVAKFIAFLALKGTYMSGSIVVLDGGLTAGMGAA